MKHALVIAVVLLSLLSTFFVGNAGAGGDDDLLMVLNDYYKLNQSFKELVAEKNHSTNEVNDKRKLVEDYHENVYAPQLDNIRAKICYTKDKELMQAFLKVMYSTENSADEAPLVIFGEIYLCQPALVESTINMLDVSQKATVINSLEFGFMNAASGNESNYEELRKKLELIKTESN